MKCAVCKREFPEIRETYGSDTRQLCARCHSQYYGMANTADKFTRREIRRQFGADFPQTKERGELAGGCHE